MYRFLLVLIGTFFISGCGSMCSTMTGTSSSSSSNDGSSRCITGHGSVLELDWKSCEMIADDLYTQIAARYAGRAVWIEVAEDGENGCLIKYETSRPYSINQNLKRKHHGQA
jgi:hypothetical protein